MDNKPKQPIIRYLLIGLAFVLVFVGVAYLAFLFSGRGERTTTRPQVTPTPTAEVSLPPEVVNNRPVLPPPVLPPIEAGRPTPLVVPIAQVTPFAGPRVLPAFNAALDGRGNLLTDKPLFTHEEHAALERERIQAETRRELAKLELERERLGEETRRRDRTLGFREEQTRARLANNQQLLALQNQRERQLLQTQVELERLTSQLALARTQTEGQKSNELRQDRLQLAGQLKLNESQTTNQIRLLQAQSEAQARLSGLQSLASLVREGLQTTSQIERTNNLTDNQIRLTKAQLSNDAVRFSLEEKRRLAEQAFSLASRRNDQAHALAAARLQTDLNLLERAQAHEQQVDLANLQARIQENFLNLQRYVNQPFFPFSGYSGSGYGGCGGTFSCF